MTNDWMHSQRASDEAGRLEAEAEAIGTAASSSPAASGTTPDRETFAANEAKIATLREQIWAERKKHHTLLFLKMLYERRLPQLRNALGSVREAVRQLGQPRIAAGGARRTRSDVEEDDEVIVQRVDERVVSVTEQATRLQDVCTRLDQASRALQEGSSTDATSESSAESAASRLSFGGFRAQYDRDRRRAKPSPT